MTNSIHAVQGKLNPLIFQNGCFNSTTHRSGPTAQLSSLYSHQTWGGGLHSGHVGEGLQGSFFWVNSICWSSVIACSFTPCVCFLPSWLPKLQAMAYGLMPSAPGLCKLTFSKTFQKDWGNFPAWLMKPRSWSTSLKFWREWQQLYCCDLTIIFEKTVAHFSKSCFSVTQVAESFLQLVTDETKNGEALMVLPAATCYMEFPTLVWYTLALRLNHHHLLKIVF